MDFSTLADFRRKTYACFGRAADALMNAIDALLAETPARSLAEQLQEATECIAQRFLFLGDGYRTAKQDLLWETPRLRTPEQLGRWTDVVSVVRNTLFLAHDLVAAQRRPRLARAAPLLPNRCVARWGE